MSQYNGSLFVVVNTTRSSMWGRDGEYRVMPGEEPHTYGSVRTALGQVAILAVEHGHDLTTAQIFELVPVPLTGEMEAELEDRVKELNNEMEV